MFYIVFDFMMAVIMFLFGMWFYMREKCGIDAKAEANRIPFRESFSLVERKVAPGSMQTAGKFLAASICNYYALLGVCLKTGFNFSKRQVAETLELCPLWFFSFSIRRICASCSTGS